MKRRLLINSLSGAILFLANLAIAFVLSPIILRQLGNRDYGIWEIVLSLCGYLGILEIGIGPAIIRFVSREQSVENREGLDRILSSAFLGLLSLCGVALVLFGAAAVRPEAVLGIPAGEIDGLSLLLVIVGCSVCVQFLGMPFMAYLMGCQEHSRINGLRTLLAPLQATLLYLVLTKSDGNKLNLLAGVGLLGNAVQYGMFAAITLRRPEVSLRLSAVSRATLKELYRFGTSSMILMVSDRVQRLSLPLIIGHTLGAASVVFFAIPKRLIDYARNLVLALGFPIMPYLSAIEAKGVSGGCLGEWVTVSRAIYFVTVPCALVVLVLGEEFITRWIGFSYADEGKWVLVALGLSTLLTGPFANASRVLLAGARHGRPARRVLIVSALAVALAVPATKWMGVSGAAAVLAVGELGCSWVLWRAASNMIGLGLRQHLRMTVRPFLGPASVMLAVLITGEHSLRPSSYGDLAGIAVLSSSLYLAVSWRFAISRDERAGLRTRIGGLLRRYPGGEESAR